MSLDLPSGRGFIALLEAFRATGGTAPREILGWLLEDHPLGEAVSFPKPIHTGRAFGFEWRDCLWIPMFRFDDDDLALKASAQGFRAELPSLWSGWQLATWLATPNARLGGRSLSDTLDSDVAVVMQAVQSLALGQDLSVPLARRAHEVATQV